MMRPLRLAAVIAATIFCCGCTHGALYAVFPLPADAPRQEVKPEKLDGHWFQRDIFASGSGSDTDAIELMYCPIVQGAPTVCRTAVVWQKGVTGLLEGDTAKP